MILCHPNHVHLTTVIIIIIITIIIITIIPIKVIPITDYERPRAVKRAASTVCNMYLTIVTELIISTLNTVNQ